MLPFYSFIYARDLQGALGRGGAVPWRAPADLDWFRTHTAGKLSLVGARTYRGLPPLPGRRLLVVGRDPPAVLPAGVVAWVPGVAEAAAWVAGYDAHPEVMVLGGGALYRAVLGEAGLGVGVHAPVRRRYETVVEIAVAGADTFLPPFPGTWTPCYERSRLDARAQFNGDVGLPLTFRILDRTE